jgi:hypothetical protein
VAVHNGKVVDSDADRLALLRRVREHYTHAPVLITPAVAESPRHFSRTGLRRS